MKTLLEVYRLHFYVVCFAVSVLNLHASVCLFFLHFYVVYFAVSVLNLDASVFAFCAFVLFAVSDLSLDDSGCLCFSFGTFFSSERKSLSHFLSDLPLATLQIKHAILSTH